MSAIRKIVLPLPQFDPLQQEARAEGYDFVDTTVREWSAGENQFDGPGECLCGSFDGDGLIAIGGLTRDPFLDDPSVGRLRRIYVRAAWRNRGVGKQMVQYLLHEAKTSFGAVRLRAENDLAARPYEDLGFSPLIDAEATHRLLFDKQIEADCFRNDSENGG